MNQTATGKLIPIISNTSTGAQKIVGYFTEWGVYGRDFFVADIPADKITHLNYGFAAIAGKDMGTCQPGQSKRQYSDGDVVICDPWASLQMTSFKRKVAGDYTWTDSENEQAGNIGEMKRLKQKYPQLKTLISIGGWTLS